MSIRIGVDVGGTFTDLVAYDPATGSAVSAKWPSTVEAPEAAVIESVARALGSAAIVGAEYFLHGTTVGLNALLQRSGARVGLLATSGFRDVLEIRRGSREQMLTLAWRPPVPLVPRSLRIPARERTRADGAVLVPLNDDDVAEAVRTFAADGVDAVAIAFINAFQNPANELAAADALRRHGFTGAISLSHRVSGEYREFERTSTTVIDAYVGQVAGGYLERLGAGLRRLGCQATMLMMRSGGGAMTFDEAAARPFETIISGPVAGVEGAATLARELDCTQLIAADVGGTSFDVSVILDGRPQILNQGEVIGFPIQAPWVDVRSIGAGGGSIAEIDAGGLLRVGPRSAGAQPGPVCYGRGGTEPTVTDAALVLGMLGEGSLASGLQLSRHLAVAALASLATGLAMSTREVAAGIMRVAAAHMVDAMREITVERGLDPRDGALMAFGGAGGLFAALLAAESDISMTIVPPHAGTFSAWGLLGADITRSAAQTVIQPLNDATMAIAQRVLAELFDDLRKRPGAGGLGGAIAEAALDLRYIGQEYSLTIAVPIADERIGADPSQLGVRFEAEYEKIFGHRMEEEVEVVAVRATLRTALPRRRIEAAPPPLGASPDRRSVEAFSFARGSAMQFSSFDRDSLAVGTRVIGPALIREDTAMTYLDQGFRAEIHDTGCILITPSQESSA